MVNKQAIVSFDESSNELLLAPECAALYFEECLEDGDIELFKLALKDIADVQIISLGTFYFQPLL